jgi:hypothetical protein
VLDLRAVLGRCGVALPLSPVIDLG